MTRSHQRGAANVLHFVLAAIPLAPIAAQAGDFNGFDVSGASIPIDEIHRGGPPRDAIPAIDQPRFVAAQDARFLSPDSRVLGISLHGRTKAYPIAILNWHEVVNDTFGRDAVAITFCPLCGTGMAFRAGTAAEPMRFGVSGLLYNSDVLLFDRETSSLWSQILASAISGPLRGRRLEAVPVLHTSWADWRARHPETVALSPQTGFLRDYGRDPYAGYAQSDRVMFPVGKTSRRYHPKERVIGVSVGGRQKAYPFVELERSPGRFDDRIGDAAVTVEFDAVHRTGRVLDAGGQEIASVIAFWFAWYAFHPDTAVHEASAAKGSSAARGHSP